MKTTGAFRFTELRRWFRRPVMVLECEVESEGRRRWIPAPADLAAEYATNLCARQQRLAEAAAFADALASHMKEFS